MSNPSQEDPKPDGAAFDDFFESLGKKAEHLTVDEQNGSEKSPVALNGTAAQPEGEDDQKVVDEIESLCMNCHENVGPPLTISSGCS
jgi:zinc finger protein